MIWANSHFVDPLSTLNTHISTNQGFIELVFPATPSSLTIRISLKYRKHSKHLRYDHREIRRIYFKSKLERQKRLDLINVAQWFAYVCPEWKIDEFYL